MIAALIAATPAGAELVIEERSDMQASAPAAFQARALEEPTAGVPFCDGDGVSGSRIQAVYGHVAGTPDRYAESIADITVAAGAIDDAFDLSAGRQGGSAHPRWAFEPGTCEFSVLKVELPAGAADDFDLTLQKLGDLGLRARTDRKYVVWVDAEGAENLIATTSFDEDPNPATNASDGGALQASVAQLARNSGWDDDGFGGPMIMWGPQHEVSHMLGAVMPNAPHAIPGAHCSDNHDAMCFSETPVAGCESFPADKQLLDCNADDYFAVDPPDGSYLDTHWNTYNSSFLVRSDTPDAPPVTTITGGPTGTVDTGSAEFTFSSSDAGLTFECRLDGAEFEPCPSPKSYSGLADGSHTFEVRAVDPAGNRDFTPATRTWTVDAPEPVAPDTTITSAPAAVSDSADASFEFTSDPAGAEFECRLGGAEFAACTSPKTYSGLANGEYVFQVRAKDGGLVDSTPAEHEWTVAVDDPPPPPVETRIQRLKVKHRRGMAVARFRALGGTGKVTFKCKIDRGKWRACRSPKRFKRLKRGRHVLKVRAFDANGRDRTPAKKRFRIKR